VAFRLRIATSVAEIHILAPTKQEVEWLVTKHATNAVVNFSSIH
jgi:hypothetical protein